MNRHLLPIVYLVAILSVETVVRIADARLGLVLYCLLLVALVHVAALGPRPSEELMLAIALVPLVRVVSLALPLGIVEEAYRPLAVAIPGIVAVGLAARAVGASRTDIGLVANPGAWLFAGLAGPAGLLWGVIEYSGTTPLPLISRPLVADAVAPALAIIVSTGFTEELVFRGFIQGAAVRRLGSVIGAAFATFLFALVATDPWTPSHFALVVALGASMAVLRGLSRSIVPAVAFHGAFNIGLFLVAPFALQG